MLDKDIKKIAIVGDLHGNWDGFQWNMQKLARLGLVSGEGVGADGDGWLEKWTDEIQPASDAALVFTGDLLDRGMDGLPIMYIVYSLMAKFPEQIFACSGNHDFDAESAWNFYGFKLELQQRGLSDLRGDIDKLAWRIPAVHFLIHDKIVLQCHHGLSLTKTNVAEANKAKAKAAAEAEAKAAAEAKPEEDAKAAAEAIDVLLSWLK